MICLKKVFVHELKFTVDQSDYAVNLVDSSVNVFIEINVCLKQYPLIIL